MVSVSVSISNTISTSVQVTEVVNAVASVLACSSESAVCDYTKPVIEIDDSYFEILFSSPDQGTRIDFGSNLNFENSGNIIYFELTADFNSVIQILTDTTPPDGFELFFIGRSSGTLFCDLSILGYDQITGGGAYSAQGVLSDGGSIQNQDYVNTVFALKYIESSNKWEKLFTGIYTASL